MELLNKYEVTQNKRSEEFFQAYSRIKKDFILDSCKSNTPSFILAGGQPGSGKTALIKTIKMNNPNISFVTIDLDVYRSYHPDFEEIKKNHKQDGVILTNSFAFAIEDEMIKYAEENSLNVINVSTLRNTHLIEQAIVNKIIPHGFRVETYVLAVTPEESYFSAVNRYLEQQKDKNCVTRFTSREFHDISYRNFNETVKRINNMGIPIIVCKRAVNKDEPPEIVYDERNKINAIEADSPIDAIYKIRQSTKNFAKINILNKMLNLENESMEIQEEYIEFLKEINKT